MDANVFAAIVPVLAHVGDAARYEDFGQRFRTARTPQEEQRYLLALAGFRPPELVEKTLAKTLNGDVRTQDAMYVLNALLMSVHGRERAWAFLQENWERLNSTLPPNGIRRVCEAVVGLARPDWERQVHAFFEAKKVNLGGKKLEQFLEQLRIVVRLREREAEALGRICVGEVPSHERQRQEPAAFLGDDDLERRVQRPRRGRRRQAGASFPPSALPRGCLSLFPAQDPRPTRRPRAVQQLRGEDH